MAWESDSGDDARDNFKFVWLGIGVLFIAMVGAIWFSTSRTTPDKTEVNIRQILVKFDESKPEERIAALEKIEGLRQMILDGQSFASVAKKYSEDVYTAARGGDVSWVPEGILAQEIDTFAWSAPIGEVSNVIKTNYGYHIAIVVDRRYSVADEYERELQQKIIKEDSEAKP